MTKKTLLRW